MITRLIRPITRALARSAQPPRVDLPLATWSLARGTSGVLALDGVPLDALLDRWGSPLHVVNAGRLDRNVNDFLALPAGAAHGVEVRYSFKTNPVPGVLRRLRARGVGAEVISEHELRLALQLGFAPAEIVYDGPAKSPASLRLAIERGVDLINLNSRCEIAPLAILAREIGRRPRVGVRIVVPGSWGGQLGERVDTGAALRAFTEASRAPELHVAGLHVHLGGEIASEAQLRDFVVQVLRFADELHHRLGLDLEVLDLGGSLACPTVRPIHALEARLNQALGIELSPRLPGSALAIRDAMALLILTIEDHYRQAGRARPRIVVEPGRAVTGDAQLLLTRVVNVQDEEDGVTHAVLDAGFCVASPVPNEVHEIYPVALPRGGQGQRRRYRLVGPVCSPADVLYASRELPALAPGDALAIMDSGAYFVPFASSFSFPQPAIVMIEDGRDTVVRLAETFEHMTALDGPCFDDGTTRTAGST
jgi:diaminopimelate decarboxylase